MEDRPLLLFRDDIYDSLRDLTKTVDECKVALNDWNAILARIPAGQTDQRAFVQNQISILTSTIGAAEARINLWREEVKNALQFFAARSADVSRQIQNLSGIPKEDPRYAAAQDELAMLNRRLDMYRTPETPL